MMLKKKILLFLFLLNPFVLKANAQMDSLQNQKDFVIPASFKSVWKATQLALNSYPLDVNDMDNGLIKTQALKPEQIWIAPFEKPLPTNYRQTFTIRFIKLDPRHTKMMIEKQGEIQTDFLGTSVSQFSSGWEELRLYYKIRREIDIERVLARVK